MGGLEWKGSVYRIRKCALDFISMEDELLVEDDDDDSWELMGKDISLKSTFLYCDLNRVITNARGDRKKALTELANRLFYNLEELVLAVKSRSISLTQDRYNDAALLLQELVATLIPAH